ncbi:MAG: branched chain amino acid aminotransferase [Nitrososphaerota archaeon]
MPPQASYIWMDGQLVPWAEAKVHVFTHSLHYGSAVFEGIKAYEVDGALCVFRLEDHMKRLLRSASLLHLNCRFSLEQLCEAVTALLKANRFQDSVYIRPLLYVGPYGISLDYSGFETHVAILAFPFRAYFEKLGLRVCTSSWRRLPESSVPLHAKAAANYLNLSLATIEARRAGYDEAILLDQEGFVSEGAGENVFLVKDNRLITPSPASSILHGITRHTVLTMANDMGLEVEERRVARSELYEADELFFTGTATEIQSVLSVDGREIGGGKPGRLTLQLIQLYGRTVRGQEPRYLSWVTKVDCR